MENSKLVAVWGSPGSGTTLTSLKLARELSILNKNVILVLSDAETPMIPVIAPTAEKVKSLGNLLSLPSIKQIDIFRHCIPVGKSLSLLGYLREENEATYPDYNEIRVGELIDLSCEFSDYVVVDCSHHLLYNPLTAIALRDAVVTLRVVNADPKSLSYIKSQAHFFKDSEFQYYRQINIINNVYDFQDVHAYEESFGGKSYILPHVPALQKQFAEARLMDNIAGREGRRYEPQILAIVKEEILNAQQPEQSTGGEQKYSLQQRREGA